MKTVRFGGRHVFSRRASKEHSIGSLAWRTFAIAVHFFVGRCGRFGSASINNSSSRRGFSARRRACGNKHCVKKAVTLHASSSLKFSVLAFTPSRVVSDHDKSCGCYSCFSSDTKRDERTFPTDFRSEFFQDFHEGLIFFEV